MEMKTLVLTGFRGTEFAQMAEYTVPLFLRYANRHGAAFECRHLVGPRPPSWMKIPAILQSLTAHDAVLWIDVDVVIVDSSASIFDAVPAGAWQALVEHGTECGQVPNCGVWVVTNEMRPWLRDAWESGQNIDHPWWEQAGVLERMGYAVNGVHSSLADPTVVYEHTTFLDPEWNHHPYDARRVELHEAKFVHVTQYDDRIGAIGELARGAT